MSEGGGLVSRQGMEPTRPGHGPPTSEERSWAPEPGMELLRSALGLLIGLAATGIGALLAEVTASRGTRGERH